MVSESVKRGIRDLRYLLNRGYPRSSAVEFVSDHYQLELDDRHLLARCVFSDEEVRKHQKLRSDVEEVSDCEIGVDGYNVIITVESIQRGKRVVICDDGFVRDLRALFGKYRMDDHTDMAVETVVELLRKIDPARVEFFYDKQVSKSGELAGFTRRVMDDCGLEGGASTSGETDAEVRKMEIAASSDRAVIEKSRGAVDLPGELLGMAEEGQILDLWEI